METVTWDEASSYCQQVGMRLPTEAEWEYAARAGNEQRRYGEMSVIAWHEGNAEGKPHEVGQKAPNAWRLYDTLGNVWEWTSDWFAEQLPFGQTDAAGPSSGEYRVVRGGGWGYGSDGIRVSVRFREGPTARDGGVVGVRCVGQLP